jgi:deazaflavin-dependent oxidoreductase (nitroreductase family)
VARNYRVGVWRRLVNAAATGAIRAAIGPKNTYLLTTRGRKTGVPRTTPVIIVEDQGHRWLVAPYGPVSWVHNARASGRVTLTRGRTSDDFAIREASAGEAGPVLKRYVSVAPIVLPYFEANRDSPSADFVREAAGHPVFELLALASAHRDQAGSGD